MTRTRKEKEEEKLAHDIDPEMVKIVSDKARKAIKRELADGGIDLDIQIDHREGENTGEIVVGYALDEGEDYSFLDPEPLTGYTLMEEIKFCLYSCQAELNRLEKLINTYEDVSRLQ
jgi:hypothetical protein